MFERVDNRFLALFAACLLLASGIGFALTSPGTQPTAQSPDQRSTQTETFDSATTTQPQPPNKTQRPESISSATTTTREPTTTTQEPTTTTREPTITTDHPTTTTKQTGDDSTDDSSSNTGDDDSTGGDGNTGDDGSTGDDGEDDNTGGDDGDDGDGGAVTSPPEDRSSAYYRYLATRLLDDQFQYTTSARSLDPSVDQLNRTFQFYTSRNRTNSSQVFTTDLQLTTKANDRNLTRLLVASDRRLATQAIQDADRLAAIYRTRDLEANWSRINTSLDAARTHLDDASQQTNATAPTPNAIGAYEQAWLDAQRAIDALNAANDPTLTLQSRADPIRNGTTNYTVRGTVSDVRTHALSNVTISLDGTPVSTVPIRTNTTPGTTGYFAATVAIPDDPTTLTITVNDTGTRYADNETYETQTTRETLQIDGDGLTDAEEERLGTDPLDPDSVPADVENTSLADNGILDGREDYDNDTLSTRVELDDGLDPLSNDTDDDGLHDGFERRYAHLNATSVDTDGDGVPDGSEDYDNDTLDALAEQTLGSSPRRADTDHDGWNDSVERTQNTSLVDADTDADGLADPVENTTEFDTDPLNPDTDDDGVLDGNETYETTVENETLNVSIDIRGAGNVAEYTRVTRENRTFLQTPGLDNASRSALIQIRSWRNVSNATITFRYNESEVLPGGERSLAIYRYNESRQTYVRLDTSVDAKNNTVAAQTPHFSTYVVFQSRAWDAFDERDAPSPYSVAEEFTDEAGWTGDGEIRGSRVVVDAFTESTPEPEVSWPTLGGSSNRTGYVDYDTPTELVRRGEIDAFVTTPDSDVYAKGVYHTSVQPVVEGDTLYSVGHHWGSDQYVYRINATTDEVEWKTSIGDRNWVQNGLTAKQGQLYVQFQEQLFSVNQSTGAVDWNRSLGCSGEYYDAPVVTGGRVVVACGDSLYAFDPTDGSRIWTHDEGVDFAEDPVAGERSVFYHGEHKLVAVNLETGATTFTKTFGDKFGPTWRVNQPLRYADGTVYAASAERIVGFDAVSGLETFRVTAPTNRSFSGTPTIVGGRVVIGADSEYDAPEPSVVTAYDTSTGRTTWTRTGLTRSIGTADISSSNGTVYVMGQDLFVLDASTGATLTRAPYSSEERSSRYYDPGAPVLTRDSVYLKPSGELLEYDAAPPTDDPQASAWSAVGGGSARTGQITGDGPRTLDSTTTLTGSRADSVLASGRYTIWTTSESDQCEDWPCPGANYTVTVYDRTDDSIAWDATTSTTDQTAQLAMDDGRVFGVTENGSAAAYGLGNGTRLWQHNATPFTNTTGYAPIRLVSPTADGEQLYFSIGRTVFALDQRTGERVWRTKLSNASAGGVAVENGTVFVSRQNVGVVALNASTGATNWETDIDSPEQYSVFYDRATPVVANGSVYVAAHSKLVVLEADTGQTTVAYRNQSRRIVSKPAVANGRVVLTTAGRQEEPSRLVALTTGSHELLWETKTHAVLDADLILGDDTVYVVSQDIESYEAATGLPVDSARVVREGTPKSVAATGDATYVSEWGKVTKFAASASAARSSAGQPPGPPTLTERAQDTTGTNDRPVAKATVSKSFDVRATGNTTLDVGLSAYVREDSAVVTVRVVSDSHEKRVFTVNSLDDETVVNEALSTSLDSFTGERVTVEIVVEGEARAVVDYVRYRADSDGDGLTDNQEQTGFRTGVGGVVKPSPYLPDTDHDGLRDGEELDVRTIRTRRDRIREVVVLRSDPTDPDTDDDGLGDATEVEGWSLHVYSPSNWNGEKPYRWDYANESDATIHVDSSPLFADTDRDGATDLVEKNDLHTDPRESVTYGVTRQHLWEVLYDISQMRSNRRVAFIEAMGLPCFGEGCELEFGGSPQVRPPTDASADFDFVYPGMERGKSFDNLNDKLQFTALDGTTRIDTWVRNDVELEHGTDVWDPDTDDDGLTDGQEIFRVLGTKNPEQDGWRPSWDITGGYENGMVSEPTEADTDGDGYWDGWFGVYGVGRTADVVLYRHNLDDAVPGVRPHEGAVLSIEPRRNQTVNEIAGTHGQYGTDGERIPSGTWAIVNGDRIHSNVHIGERHWASEVGGDLDADPVDASETPNPRVPIEMDYYQTTDLSREQLQEISLDIERTYALYGITVQIGPPNGPNLDDGLSKESLGPNNAWNDIDGERSPVSQSELNRVESREHDRDSESAYLVMVPELAKCPELDWSLCGNQHGMGSTFGFNNQRPTAHFGAAAATQYRTPKVTVTAIHEIGHLLQAGVADDRRSGNYEEVYSNSIQNYESFPGEEYDIPALETGDDRTPEILYINGSRTYGWSIMADAGSAYFGNDGLPSFTLEELFWVDTCNLESYANDDRCETDD